MDNSVLEQAYLDSNYQIFNPPISIKIGNCHANLDEFLIDNSAYSWAFISAYNPYSKLQSNEKNEKAHLSLQQWFFEQGYLYCEGVGIPKDVNWEKEKSLFVLDISLKNAIATAVHFQQNAIVFGRINQIAQLIWCI